ncbi:MAG: hypothetical protein JW772_02125 [Candidatus Diapherotrites archaeon]|nr:hypothetical protein [Candidatus Diapherotrites archaeon]
MNSGKSTFALSVKEENAKKLVAEFLTRERNWPEPKKVVPKIFYYPYFSFYYDFFTEHKTDSEKKIGKTKRGKLVLNATTGEINREASKHIENQEITGEFEKNSEFQPIHMTFEEAEKIVPIKTAELLETHTENLIITQLKEVWLPVWHVAANLEGTEYTVKVSATTGIILNPNDLPERKKGVGELAEETIYELRSPSAWAKYSVGTGKTIAKSRLWKNKWFLIAILIAIIIAIVVLLP